ncbi:MAG TPA: hypothetical protein VGG64_23130 [Pirellulales bacterium]
MSSSHRSLLGKALLWASLVASSVEVRAQVVVRQDFDGPDTTWRDGRGSPSYRTLDHRRTSEGARTGAGCEFFAFASGGKGTFVYLIHDLAPARIIDELKPSLWVRSDQQGIQLLARVVFPRSINPETKQPDSTLIAGTSYARVGSWEQLRIEDVPKLMAGQARVLRAEFKREVDSREAFIDRLVLNIYTAPGQTRLWIDDLEVAGFVGEAAMPAGTGPLPSAVSHQPGSRAEPVPAGPTAPRRQGPQLKNDMLLVGERPFFPRAIEYQGEPFTVLKDRGFNTVRLRALPSDALLAEANKTGLWLICPPPLPAGLDRPVVDAAPLAGITAEFDCVLAWDLGEGLTGRELAAVKRWAEQVRRADQLARPIICGASADLREYSAPGRADILVLDRFTPSTSFELNDYRRWLHERPRFARYGTPIWSTVPTEPAATLVSQLVGFSAGRPVNLLAGTEQTRLVAYTALGAGARGLIFASHAPLTGQDVDTRWRASQLELLNLELELIEPWIAAGTLVTTVSSTDNEVQAAVLQTNGAHLVLPVWSGKGAQFVPGHATATGELSFRVPGVPETMKAYEIWPGGMRLIRTLRVTGGVNVTIDNFGLTSMVLITQDLQGEVMKRASQARDHAAKLLIEMATVKLQIDTDVRGQLSNRGKAKTLAPRDQLLQTARTELQSAETSLGRGNVTDAFRFAQLSLRNLRAMERDYWLAATAKLGSPVSNPYAVAFATLPQHFSLVENVDGARRMKNLLPEGNFEDLGRAINAAGWKHYQHPLDGVREEAEISQAKFCEGKHSLRMAAKAIDPEAPPDQIETPPGWITSPVLTVEPGTLLRLHGRVLVPAPIKGSPDGLLIIDSLGGEALAERIVHAPDWKEFIAYRVADASRGLTLTFALTGLGEVWIDDVTIEPVLPRTAAPGSTRPPADPAANRRLPLLR